MKPIFPFYGSKWRDAKRYSPPEHGHERRGDVGSMSPERATFQVKPADAGWMDLGSVAIGCDLDYDAERKQWRAWDEHGNEAWAEWKPLAAARLFVACMEAAINES